MEQMQSIGKIARMIDSRLQAGQLT
jgi:hypothetical protein